jgi:hypothetical protein
MPKTRIEIIVANPCSFTGQTNDNKAYLEESRHLIHGSTIPPSLAVGVDLYFIGQTSCPSPRK